MPDDTARPAYLDTTLSPRERAADLVGRLTLQEKSTQMRNHAPAIPRLGIPAYNWWNEALHGVARNGRATVFPQAIGLAATWNPALIHRVASAIADEGRAKHHAALRRQGHTGWYQGLTFWSPNVNIFRDPRWGRGQETWGEDPFLTGEMGAAFVRGMQGDDPKYLKTAACAKHFAVHSGPEGLRHGFDAVVSPRELRDTYLPAFRKLVREADVEAVMGAYNRLLGEPCCASKLLLEDILRDEWGFEGHVVSDCGAIHDIHAGHHVTADAAESAALAVRRGCDLACDGAYDRLPEAVGRGLIDEAEIDRSLTRVLATRFKLGMFDPPEEVPYASIPMSVVGCDEHRALARQAAVESVVLLKNDGILPIGPVVRSIMVVGPNAASIDPLLGNYNGLSDRVVTLLEGIVGRAAEGVNVSYRTGCLPAGPVIGEPNWIVEEAAGYDVVLACMGTTRLMEGEESEAFLSDSSGDRREIGLPATQVDLLTRLARAGARLVLVLTGGSPIALGELADFAAAIVFVWYPGQEGGAAVADVLFGFESPSGKLPLTFPKSVDDLPPFDDYSMAGRTYRYATREPLYPFGFGLNYTSFRYSDLSLARERVPAGEPFALTFTLTNTGAVAATEVAQIYLSDLEASSVVPMRKLIGFQRVALAPGESRALTFTVTPEMMSFYDDAGGERLEPGAFRLTVGGCSPGERGLALGAPQPVTAEFVVV